MDEKPSSSNAAATLEWYDFPGKDDDVVLSTRVRLARNLADFPFPHKLSKSDKQRVQTLAFDAFTSSPHSEKFICIDCASQNVQNIKILKERGLLGREISTGTVINSDGNSACIINGSDHLKIVSYASGLDYEKAAENCFFIDGLLQDKLQIAASFQFGYLTSDFCNSGTGMKITVRIHIPATILSGAFPSIIENCKKHNFQIKKVTDSRNSDFIPSIFDISTANSCCSSASLTEFEQAAEIISFVQMIIKTERKIRKETADNERTALLNLIRRNYVKAEYSLLIEETEAMDFISAVKLGLHTNTLEGVTDTQLHSMFYKTKYGYIKFLMENGEFTFEKDIKNKADLKTERLRAAVLQDLFKSINFYE